MKGGSKNERRKLDEGREELVEKVRLKGGIWMKDENNGDKGREKLGEEVRSNGGSGRKEKGGTVRVRSNVGRRKWDEGRK